MKDVWEEVREAIRQETAEAERELNQQRQTFVVGHIRPVHDISKAVEARILGKHVDLMLLRRTGYDGPSAA